MIEKYMTIAEAIKENPDIIQLLSDHDIDYCCEGQRKLADATKDRNLDPAEFISQLNSVRAYDENLAFKEALSMKQPEEKKKLIAHIIKHHHRVEERLLSELGEYLPILLRVHYDEHGEELSRLYRKFSQLNAELTIHLTKEERSEFPFILEGEEIDSPALIAQHKAIGALLNEAKHITNSFIPPADSCQTYELAFAKLKELYDDIHRHFFLEENVLFI